MQNNLNFAKHGQVNQIPLQTSILHLRISKSAVAIPVFKPWFAAALTVTVTLKKRVKCYLNSLNYLLKDLRVNLSVPMMSFLELR